MCLLPINSAPIQSIPTPSVIYILNCERSTATHFAVQNNSQSSFSIQASRGPCVQRLEPCVQRLEVDGTCWRHYITSVLSQTAEVSRCPDHGPAALLHYCSAAGPWVCVSSLALWFDRCPVWPVQIHAEMRNSYCLPDANYLPSLIVPGIDTLRERREVLTSKFLPATHCSTACCPIDETMTLPAVCETLNCFIHFEHEQIDSANYFYRTV